MTSQQVRKAKTFVVAAVILVAIIKEDNEEVQGNLKYTFFHVQNKLCDKKDSFASTLPCSQGFQGYPAVLDYGLINHSEKRTLLLNFLHL